MNIITSKYGGFCPGVRQADKKIRALLKEKQPNEKIYIIGQLIHNDIYNRELEALGANIISFDCIEKIIENEELMHTFVIRTHGVTKEKFDFLIKLQSEYKNVRVEDLTCPSVKKIHRIAETETNDDTFFVMFGNPEHDEAIGNISYANEKKAIISSLEDARL